MNVNALSHQQLYSAVKDGSLPPEDFDHEAHVRLAWFYLVSWPYEEAREKFNTDFRQFIIRAGAQGKYHKTITDALLQLISSHLDNEDCRSDWDCFKKDAEPLFADAYGLLQRFYSPGLLESDIARKQFKNPDIKDMPDPYKQI